MATCCCCCWWWWCHNWHVMHVLCEVVRNLSVITAVEESDGRDSSVVRRPIEIVSNPRHNRGCTVRRPLNGMGLKGKVLCGLCAHMCMCDALPLVSFWALWASTERAHCLVYKVLWEGAIHLETSAAGHQSHLWAAASVCVHRGEMEGMDWSPSHTQIWHTTYVEACNIAVGVDPSGLAMGYTEQHDTNSSQTATPWDEAMENIQSDSTYIGTCLIRSPTHKQYI